MGMSHDWERRLAALEAHRDASLEVRREILAKLETLAAEVRSLKQFLSENGRLTIVFEKRRVKFAGSLPLPLVALGGPGGGAGIVWLVGRALGVW